uniref:Glycoside hydrolase family 6 protein n=1 Tax=Globisporangium ultimum (strain ATCC 200006 / CBS 805.95 / DAOM BR144) TaxID=431595 RepID=K3WJB6_GLOUD
MRRLTLSITALVLTAAANAEQLCSLPPITYAAAKAAHPEAAFALSELETRGIATWYSDREENGDYVTTAKQLVALCPDDSRLSVVIYGLPNKDCDAGYSTIGSRNKSPYDYEQFVSTLAQIIGQRKVLYVLEPDAVGLLVGSTCAVQSGYKDNLKTAIRILSSSNANADIYLDVGYWTLAASDSRQRVADVVRELAAAGRVKGIALNTSNYRSNGELAHLCSSFQSVMGYNGMNCIIDTSRNFHGSSSSEWCNLKSAGIGKPPTRDTGYPNIDYFVWVKPPGDSDGTCSDGASHTWEALPGPGAGMFFEEGFRLLWNQGSLVQELNLPVIDSTYRSYSVATATPTSSPTPNPTPAPTEMTPSPELLAVQALMEAMIKAQQQQQQQFNSGSGSSSDVVSSEAGSLPAGSNSSALASDPDAGDVSEDEKEAEITTPSPFPSDSVKERGITTRANGGPSDAKVGVIITLFVAGIATVVGVMLFVRLKQKQLQDSKSPNLSYLPATPN